MIAAERRSKTLDERCSWLAAATICHIGNLYLDIAGRS